MPTMCIQCAMRAMLKDQPSPVFDEEPADHQRLFHADLAETQRERRELELLLAEKLGGPKSA